MPRTTTVLLTPMTPDAVMSAFNYLRAVEAGDTEAASEFTAPSRAARAASEGRGALCLRQLEYEGQGLV